MDGKKVLPSAVVTTPLGERMELEAETMAIVCTGEVNRGDVVVLCGDFSAPSFVGTLVSALFSLGKLAERQGLDWGRYAGIVRTALDAIPGCFVPDDDAAARAAIRDLAEDLGVDAGI